MSGKGVVKAVYGGDWVIVQGAPGPDGICPEKKIYFSSISAPRMNNGEAFAWDARNFLRNKVLGKQVSFKLEYKANNLEYGAIMCNGENIIEAVVAAGYARVLTQKDPSKRSAFYDNFKDAEAHAKETNIGIWTEDDALRTAATHTLKKTSSEGYSVSAMIKDPKYKGKLRGIIEEVFNGSSYIVLLLDTWTQIKINLPSVQSPSTNSPNELQKKVGLQAKSFAEKLVLHQEIQVSLISCDEKYSSFIGDVIHPKGNIVMELLKRGFAQYLHPSGNFNRDYFALLHKTQTTAQEKKLGLWQDYVKAKSNISPDDAVFQGKILEVNSGDSVTVLSEKGNTKRVFFASVRAPRFAKPAFRDNKDVKDGKERSGDENYAFEAKEFLRKQAIGRKVRVEMEFKKTIGTETQQTLEFASVFLVSGQRNLAEMLAENGLVFVQGPRYNEEGSKYITQLLGAQAGAKESKLGVHSNTNPPSHRFQDLVGPSNTRKARDYETYFSDEGGKKLKGVVEHVFNGGRYKVRIPKHSCQIGLILHGVKCVIADKNDPEIIKNLSEELNIYAKENLLQRDVEVEVDFCDKKGNYFGTIFSGKKNFATILLEHGYASCNSFGSQQVRHLAEYQASEEQARSEKNGIWGHANTSLTSDFSNAAVSQKVMDVEISEIVDASLFYIHDSANNKLEEINNKLADFDESAPKLEPPIRKGTKCVAKFSVDECWYRGIVEKTLGGGEYQVRFADYGNTEKLSVDDMRKVGKDHLAHPFQAQKCQLAYVNVPRALDDEDVGAQAAFFLRELAWGQPVKAKVIEKDENQTLRVLLTDKSGNQNFNLKMVENGFASLERNVAKDLDDYTDWDNAEMIAKQKAIGVWEGGAFSDEDDEDDE